MNNHCLKCCKCYKKEKVNDKSHGCLSQVYPVHHHLLSIFGSICNFLKILSWLFFFALPSLRHVIHISYTLTVTLKGVGYSISAAVKTEVL